jgi:hypothetical protein
MQATIGQCQRCFGVGYVPVSPATMVPRVMCPWCSGTGLRPPVYRTAEEAIGPHGAVDDDWRYTSGFDPIYAGA